MEVKTDSPEQTRKIAKKIALTLKGGEVIALFGDLGAGKTVFTQGLAQGLKIKRKITSPTFVFLRSYPFRIKGKSLTFYHVDLFRGQTRIDFQSLGLDEILSNDSIVVLEWAQKIKEWLPKESITVEIESLNEKTRKIKIKRN